MEKKENDQNDYLWMGGFQAIFTSLFEFFFIEKFQNIDKYKTENKKIYCLTHTKRFEIL